MIEEAKRNEAGLEGRECSTCGKTERREIAPYAKLSTGAVIGVTGGSLVVATAGGFSMFWFVVKKKTFGDLVGVFKNSVK